MKLHFRGRWKGGNSTVNGYRPDLVARPERVPAIRRRETAEELYAGLPRPAARARCCDEPGCRRWAELATVGQRPEAAYCMTHWCERMLAAGPR